MSFPKALIFDVDGTLADNERDGHRVAFNRAFAEAGLDWVWSEHSYRELLRVGGGKERIRHYIETAHPSLPSGISAEGDSLDPFIRDLHSSKVKFYWQLMQEQALPLRPGVMRLLLDCRQAGVRLAIATTSALPSALALIESMATDATSWFEVIAAGDVVAAKKPAPDIYEYALQQLELKPQDCIAVEDSKPGCQAAIAAGLTTIITVNGYTKEEDFSGAALVLSHLGEPNQAFQLMGGESHAVAAHSNHVDLALLRLLAP